MLESVGSASEPICVNDDILLVGCGGVQVKPTQVKPKCIHNLKMEVYGSTFSVPALVVPGQKDQVILGTNVIKHILKQFKQSPRFWQVMTKPDSTGEPEIMQFLNMLAGISRWRGDTMPDFIGTVKLVQAVTLFPKQEHLVWGKLPAGSLLSEGSAVLVEPSKTQTHKKNIIVCWSVASMNGERWIPFRILNKSDKAVTLKRHTKVADVSFCILLHSH